MANLGFKPNCLTTEVPRFAIFVCERVDAGGSAFPETAGCSLRRNIRRVLRRRDMKYDDAGDYQRSNRELPTISFLLDIFPSLI